MVGQIVFAWRSSAGLDARCKQWRLFADVLNDAAICLELAAPAFGAGVFKVGASDRRCCRGRWWFGRTERWCDVARPVRPA